MSSEPLRPVDVRFFFAYTAVVPNVCACRVSYTDTTGITHTACVAAGSLYEAAVLGVAEFRKCGFMDTEPGPTTQITVLVEGPSTTHELPMRKLMTWLESNGKSPSEQVVKVRLREMLASS